MALTYEKDAAREQVWLRAFLMGPTGSGKSLGAHRLADQIFDGKLKVTLINTERGRGKMYADRFKFDYIDLSEDGDFSPESYTKALDLAEANNPGGVYLLDSVSHEWMGKNGILSQADRFGDWKQVRPKHNTFVERMLALNGHLIVTCRAKMKYEVGTEESSGRTRQVINMLGVGPIQSDDMQYEFNLVGRFEQGTHDVTWSGHIDPLIDTVSNFGTAEQASAVSKAVTKWLTEGNPLPEPEKAASDKQVEALRKSLHEEGFADDVIDPRFDVARRENMGVLSEAYVKAQHEASKKRIAAKKPDTKPDEPAAEPAANEEPKQEAQPEEPPAEPLTEAEEAEIDSLWEKSGEGAPA